MTQEEMERLFGPASSAPQTSSAPSTEPTADQPGMVSSIASDIGTGITELPRAVLKGAREAGQETLQTVVDAGNWVGRQQDKLVGLFGGAPGKDVTAPFLPDVTAPKSATGKLAASVSQFITGMVGLGKVTKPLEVAGGLATAGRAVKATVETAKAATVGATAFDPHGPRFADLIETVPGLSNPVTRYLKSGPEDSAAEGRIKNALESIGMDAALVGGVLASTRLYKAFSDFRAGKTTQAELDRVVAEAKAVEQPAPSSASGNASEVSAPGKPEASPSGPAPEVTLLGAPSEGAPVAAPAAPAIKPQRDVWDLRTPAKAEFTLAEVTPEQTRSLLTAMQADADALTKAGSWSGATDAGHIFGQGGRIPWQKIAREDGPEGDGLAAFVTRLSDEMSAPLNAARGGDADGVLRDAKVREMVEQSARLYGDDPAQIFGRLAMAGDASRKLAVDLEVAYLTASRALQDAYAMASRIKAGDLTEWAGNADAAAESLRQTMQAATTLFGYGQAMRAGAGRAMRRMREEFGPKPEDIERLQSLDPSRLVDALVATGGDPRSIRKEMTPGALEKMQDWLEFSYVNGLLWGPRSHFVNFATNLYMLGARPLERMIGNVVLKGASTSGLIGRDVSWRNAKEAHQQYLLMGAALSNSWQMAKEAWLRGDSALAPRAVEAFQRQRINVAELQFKTPDSLGAFLHNAMVASAKVAGFPTRALGTADELVSQVVYRSKIMAQAHMEAVERGLTGDDLTRFVTDKLHGAFDDNLRATDQAALQEARIATFQQDLLPGSVGRWVSSFTAQQRWSRYILPFVKTPTNVMRYGWKLTPGLNLLQNEYRQMLNGAMGQEAQVQAIGQMTMGSLFLGYAAYLAHAGKITGGGPSDGKLKAQLMATGWQPYSFVTMHEDGSRTWTNFGRYDPVGMPFGVVADIVNAISNSEEHGDNLPHQIGAAMLGAGMSLAKQFGNKSYLKSINDTLEALMDPDRSMEKWAGQVGSNFVPFSSGLRFANPDPYLRDARDMTDRMMAGIPGLSEKLPPRRDVWGDPITVHKGLWVSTDADLVDAEVRRITEEAGLPLGAPSVTFHGVDLRDVTMVDGRNAYDAYQTYAAKPTKTGPSLKEAVGRIMKTPAYQRAPDGEAAVRGTKLWLLAGTIHKYREVAGLRLRADANVRKALAEKNRAVAEAYAASKKPQTPQQSAERGLADMGKAFGVDLEALMK